MSWDWSWLPRINAILNGASFLLLVYGYRAIRREHWTRHHRVMISAFGVSTLFLLSYLVYHAQAGTTRFQGRGWIRSVYLAILATHTTAAAVVAPLAVVILILGLRGKRKQHRRLARKVLPLWLYVSITGVVIYLILYHWPR